MDKATKTALENDAKKYRDASDKLSLHAERIEALLKSEKEIAALLPSDSEPLEFALGSGLNGSNGEHIASKTVTFFKRVIGSMTQPQACRAALEATKIPMTTGEIAATIKDLGLPVSLPKDISQLGAVLSRNKETFVTAGKGKWILKTAASAASNLSAAGARTPAG